MTARRLQPSLIAVLAVYLVLALGLVIAWSVRGWYPPTGDEPHYLVMARGLISHGSFNLLLPLSQEYANPEFLQPQFIPPGGGVRPGDFLTIVGPNGWFSMHSIGLPTLLSVPVLIGSLLGARVAMVLLGAVVVGLVWLIAARFTERPWVRFGAALAAAVAMPLIPSATQIYPDLVGGLLALTGLAWMLFRRDRAPWAEVLLSACIAVLPWLQLKFTAPMLVIVLGLVWLLRSDGRSWATLWRIWAVPAISLILVGVWNLYAYARLLGPYGDGGLLTNPTSLMVLLGLHLDQDQGFLLLNPVLFIGVFSLPLMFRRMRAFTVIWVLLFLALLLPNAMHPNWYGGGAFFARFGLAGAIVLAVPTVFGLVQLANRRPRWFWVVVDCGFALQLMFYALYGFIHMVDPRSGHGLFLYNPGTAPWLESYAFFWFPLQRLLPALYDSAWAYGYGPNLGWLLITLGVLIAGVLVARGTRLRARWWVAAGGIAVLAIISFSQVGSPGPRSVTMPAASLDVRAGVRQGTAVSATAGADTPGLMLVTPAQQLREGPYTFAFDYASTAAPDEIVGWWEMSDPAAGVVVRSGEFRGTAGAPTTLTDTFGYRSFAPKRLQFIIGWYPRGTLTVDELRFTHAPSRVS